jgi:hypothetical protein
MGRPVLAPPIGLADGDRVLVAGSGGLASADKPSLNFPVGREAVEYITEPQRHILDEIAAWRGLSEATSYDEASTAWVTRRSGSTRPPQSSSSTRYTW